MAVRMVDRALMLHDDCVWTNECAPRVFEGCFPINFCTGIKTEPGSHCCVVARGITCSNTVPKAYFSAAFFELLLVWVLKKQGRISEDKVGFRNRYRRVDHMYTAGRTIQGRKQGGLPTYCFLLDRSKGSSAIDVFAPYNYYCSTAKRDNQTLQ